MTDNAELVVIAKWLNPLPWKGEWLTAARQINAQNEGLRKARAILESDWLREHDRAVAAAAWYEGVAATGAVESMLNIRNPYEYGPIHVTQHGSHDD